jgi:hypothetical protein
MPPVADEIAKHSKSPARGEADIRKKHLPSIRRLAHNAPMFRGAFRTKSLTDILASGRPKPAHAPPLARRL